jgi:hypothetical protein
MLTSYKRIALSAIDPSNGAWIAQLAGIGIAAVSSFVMPVKSYLLCIVGLVLVDMYTGWRAAHKRSGATFNSKGMGTTIEKVMLYMLAVLICHGVDISFGLDGFASCTYAAAGLITGRELLSNLENIDAITGMNLAQTVRNAIPFLRPKGPQD